MTDVSRLVLTRKLYESINIGGLVTVTLEEIHGRTVRISVQAPRHVAVHRQEIYERIVGTGPDEDGADGECLPAWPVTGPDLAPARPGMPGLPARLEGRVRAVGAAAVAVAEGPAVRSPEVVRADLALHPGDAPAESL